MFSLHLECPANEHYRNCGSNCEPTCDNYQNVPVYCSNRASCKRGCFCDYGFVRDSTKNNTCVPIDQCPQKCDLNEYWDVNGEPCIRSIENPRPRCLFELPKASCVCDTGYRRNVSTKKCETISSLGKFGSKEKSAFPLTIFCTCQHKDCKQNVAPTRLTHSATQNAPGTALMTTNGKCVPPYATGDAFAKPGSKEKAPAVACCQLSANTGWAHIRLRCGEFKGKLQSQY